MLPFGMKREGRLFVARMQIKSKVIFCWRYSSFVRHVGLQRFIFTGSSVRVFPFSAAIPCGGLKNFFQHQIYDPLLRGSIIIENVVKKMHV